MNVNARDSSLCDSNWYLARNLVSDQSGGNPKAPQPQARVCGNQVSLFPPFERYDDITGSIFSSSEVGHANISGNTLLSGGRGVAWLDHCTNALVLKNDFSAASHRALDYYGTNGHVGAVQITKNILNQGSSYHLKSRPGDGYGFFLWRNTYTNGVGSVKPFLDSEHSPIHFGN